MSRMICMMSASGSSDPGGIAASVIVVPIPDASGNGSA
jgi:hypothetical protein